MHVVDQNPPLENHSGRPVYPSFDISQPQPEQHDSTPVLPIEEENKQESLAYRASFRLGYVAVKASSLVSEKVQQVAETSRRYVERTTKFMIDESRLSINGIWRSTKDSISLVRSSEEPTPKSEAEWQQRRQAQDDAKAKHEARLSFHASRAERLAHYAKLRQTHENGESRSRKEHRRIGRDIRAFETETFDDYLYKVRKIESEAKGETPFNRFMSRLLLRPVHQTNRSQIYSDYMRGVPSSSASPTIGEPQHDLSRLSRPNMNPVSPANAEDEENHTGLTKTIAEPKPMPEPLVAPVAESTPADPVRAQELLDNSGLLKADEDKSKAILPENEEQVEIQQARPTRRNKRRGRSHYKPQDVLQLKQTIDQELASWEALHENASGQARAQAKLEIGQHNLAAYFESKKIPQKFRDQIIELLEMPETELRQRIENNDR